MTHIDDGTAERPELPNQAAAAAAVFACDGEYWTLGYGSTTFPLKDLKGLSYLQRLLHHPGQEIHALDLMAGQGEAVAGAASSEHLGSLLESSLSIGRPGDAGEMLDVQARQQYKRRLVELRDELEDRRERGDITGAESVEQEIEFLAHELRRATGLGGRSRRAGSMSERARLNVTRAIKAAMQKISEHHSALGQHLERCVRTGSFCTYVPDRDVPISWRFSNKKPATFVETPISAPPLLLRETSLVQALADRTTFVGREGDLASLWQLLGQAKSGKGSFVMIGGAAGMGKTRMGAEIGAEASRKGFIPLSGACYDRDDSVPFIPFVEMLEAALAQAPNADAFRTALGDDACEIARLMPQLRQLFPDIPTPPELGSEQSRRGLYRAIADIIRRTARQAPMMLLLEDLHWADEGTLSLLNHLARALTEAAVVIVGTYRDEDLDLMGPLAKILNELTRVRLVRLISLAPLPRHEVATMLHHLSGGHQAPASVVNFIYSGAEGNPLFVEELFRHLAERGELLDSTGEFRTDFKERAIAVPPNLKVLLARRLGRLSDRARRVVDVAAVIGRSFTFELLHAATRVDEESVLEGVEQAEKAGIILSTIEHPDPLFQFSHELIRQAVLAGLSAPRRQRIHLNVADAIERVYAATLEADASDLAHHLWHAGAAADAERTVRYLSMAAKQAVARSANLEAITLLKRGLDLLRSLPKGNDRDEQELSLQLGLGMALMSAKGYSAAEVQETFARARELCSQVRESPQLAPAMLGLWAFYLVRAEYQVAQELAEETLSRAQHLGDRASEMEAHLRLGVTKWYIGQPREARAHLEHCIALQKPEMDRPHALLYGQDPGVAARVYLGLALWQLGYPDQALRASQEGLAKARMLTHSLSLVFALCYSAWLRMERGEWKEFAAQIDELEALSNAQEFALWGALGRMFRSVILANQGRNALALACAKEGIEAYLSIGSASGMAMFLAFQAGLNGIFGSAEEALALLSQAKEVMRAHGEFNCEAELLRLEGQVVLSIRRADSQPAPDVSADQTRAEKCFLGAIEASRKRGTKSLELRAAISLARLWRKQGKTFQAHQTLAGIYEWFSEGFDTADLRRAKTLLAELS